MPLLEKLLEDSHPYVRLAAARALVKLRSKPSAPLLARAANREATWAKDELRTLAKQLGTM